MHRTVSCVVIVLGTPRHTVMRYIERTRDHVQEIWELITAQSRNTSSITSPKDGMQKIPGEDNGC